MRSAASTGYIDRARKEAIVAETRSCVMAAQTIAAEKYGANAVDVADDDMMDAVDDIKELAEVDGDISNITMKRLLVVIMRVRFLRSLIRRAHGLALTPRVLLLVLMEPMMFSRKPNINH